MNIDSGDCDAVSPIQGRLGSIAVVVRRDPTLRATESRLEARLDCGALSAALGRV